MNGAVFWFAVAIFRLMPAAQSCCSEKLLWASEDLTKGASSEDPQIPVLEYRDGGEAYGSRRSATFRNRSMQRRLGPLPHPVTGNHAPSSPHIPGLRTCFRDIYVYTLPQRYRAFAFGPTLDQTTACDGATASWWTYDRETGATRICEDDRVDPFRVMKV